MDRIIKALQWIGGGMLIVACGIVGAIMLGFYALIIGGIIYFLGLWAFRESALIGFVYVLIIAGAILLFASVVLEEAKRKWTARKQKPILQE